MYQRYILDKIDAFNKVSYRECGQNIKSSIIQMKKNMPTRLKEEYSKFSYEMERAIFLCNIRNNIAHGGSSIAQITKEDVCVIFKIASAAIFDKNKKFLVVIGHNGECYVSCNGKMCVDIVRIVNGFRENDCLSYLVQEIWNYQYIIF